ncbi:telomerase protein component 1 isoform X2 [Scleropages formosus]|nr:telomerase protein component 1 isoform X2 [Scleropages formosus]XP_018613539.2 telomerase protein component 1 isoform X2 [Scleropages formosus]XP_018613540.2 telomerase protein component 1 isoform X2 [Scleropages formosus]
MMPLTLLKASTDLNKQVKSAGLLTTYTELNLENRILAEASASLSHPCPSPTLQLDCAAPLWFSKSQSPGLNPTQLSSTVASPILSSQLFGSQELLIPKHCPLQPLSFSGVITSGDLLSPSLVQSPAEAEGEQAVGIGEEVLSMSDDVQSNRKVWSEDSSEVSVEESALELPLVEEKEEEKIPLGHEEEFGETEESSVQEEELKDKKYLLLNTVCCSLVTKNTSPGQQGWDEEHSLWMRMKSLAHDVALCDPEFLLKVAVYTRQELNIRITANFLLALAASLPHTKPHLRRYFCAAVQLPSDWLEVVRLYSTCFSQSLPSCLKNALVDKFKQFTEYQLAKYNTRKQRCKHNRNRAKTKSPSPEQWEEWATKLRSNPAVLKKYLKMQERSAVNKKAEKFNLKKMIHRLHIREPAEHVMALMGKRYPRDHREFSRSGLRGEWDRERAGQRMKLAQPNTWERKLSQEGNKARTWEKLIDSNALPFMAMLRNLRNMITRGISEKHHEKILARLTNKETVIQSRQFPFRFLAAYKVIMELYGSVKLPSNSTVLQNILRKIPKVRKYQQLDWHTAGRKRLSIALGVPFVYRMYKMKKNQLHRASQKLYTEELLSRYQRALETAVQISCDYNVPPLPGHTVLFCVTYFNRTSNRFTAQQDFCLPLDADKEASTCDSLTPSPQEMTVLLALMMAQRCEHVQLFLSNYSGVEEVQLKPGALLQNVRHVLRRLEESEKDDIVFEDYSKLFFNLRSQNIKVDTIINLEDNDGCYDLDLNIEKYRKSMNNETLLVRLFLCSDPISKKRNNLTTFSSSDKKTDRNCVELFGFSEQILKFVAERGSARLLDHVEQMDKIHNIPPSAGSTEQAERVPALTPIPSTPRLRWRGVRVFVSSTFRDMHGERDVLVRNVFPELQRRAAPYGLHLQEVDLRWGVTEEEAGRMVELCLAEVCRSQLLLGILGERYGLVPPRPTLPELPQYRWIESAPPRLSITEMEIRQFESLYPESAESRMFFYFRSPHFSSSVPVAWRTEFAAESKESESRMSDLRNRLVSRGLKVNKNYPCEWGGVEEGKPFVSGLEKFGKIVLEDLWEALLALFVEEADKTEAVSGVTEQEFYQDAQQRQCHGREKLIAIVMAKVQETLCKGGKGLILVEGAPGDGKTVFMAALTNALRTGQSKGTHSCDVISYFTAASQSACNVEQMLRYLIRSLREKLGKPEEVSLPTTYKDLLAEFYSHLNSLEKHQSLILLIDGVDLVEDAKGQLISDWIPHCPPPGVCLVLSVTSSSSLRQILAKKKVSVSFSLGQLSLPDRREIVQKELAMYGKKLNDSAFNNQLQILLMKKGAVSPLYLCLACKELRSFAVFEKMKESLQSLPQSLRQLVQHCLSRLESQYKERGLGWAMGALAVSNTGLREMDLYTILAMCSEFCTGSGLVTWRELLQSARKPQSHVPMAVFSQLTRNIQSLIGQSYCQGPDSRLALTNPEVKLAFEELFLSRDDDRSRAHSLLAAYLWVQCDPEGNSTFLHCDTDALVHLPFHLMSSGHWAILHSLLCSFDFLYANIRNGLLHRLLETYSLFGKRTLDNELEAEDFSGTVHGDLEECHTFLKHHAHILSSWPALFVQQAFNEPEGGAAHTWAKGVLEQGQKNSPRGVHVMRWHNKPGNARNEFSELVSTFLSKPTCVALSPTGRTSVVGTGKGSLHILHMATGQEVRLLFSSCDGISGCIFLEEGLLGSTSFNGKIEMWDTDSGCRTACIDAHSSNITGSDVSADRKHFATVSLDTKLKVWASPKGTLAATLINPCPLNCVAFHPEGHILALGCWDGCVRLCNWLSGEMVVALSGHQQSVRSLSFSLSSSLLSSGSLSGEVRLWSVPTSSCVGCYQAHKGSAEVLSFMQEGRLLLSAGSDSMVKLWSGSLGFSVGQLGGVKTQTDSYWFPEVKSPALCVAVAGVYAAVGYHGDGLQLFSVESGKRIWASEDVSVSIHCLVWAMTQNEAELLVSGGGDSYMRIWRRTEGGMEPQASFGKQKAPVIAMAQSSTYLASASEDFTIALWSIQDLTANPFTDPSPVSLLRGHSKGVTCLCFSPSGEQLLSGGKDQALLVWNVMSSPPSLSQSLLHCHGDWITGCAWTPHFVVSCSVDCTVRLWDLSTGHWVQEFSGSDSLTSVCCLQKYVIAGSGQGELLVWNSESGVEITKIPAHKSTIHQCCVLDHTDSGKSQEVNEENLMVATASDDGIVKFWQPLKVHHHSTISEHSGGIQAAAMGQDVVSAFLTVSEDFSLRSWCIDTAMEECPIKKGSVTALCFSPLGQLVLLGYTSGRVEMWWFQSSVLCWKQVTEHMITAVTFLQEEQFAVSSGDCSVSLWQLAWNSQRTSAHFLHVSSYKVPSPVLFLLYCSVLFGICDDECIYSITESEETREHHELSFSYNTVPLGTKLNDKKSAWILGESKGDIVLGFIFAMGPDMDRSCSTFKMDVSEKAAPELACKTCFTAATLDKEFMVCGDSRGNLWFNMPPELSSWKKKMGVHHDRITVLRLTDNKIISASHDRTVKLWDLQTKKQVGLFICKGPVVSLEVNPCHPNELVCADRQGQVYYLSWRE